MQQLAEYRYRAVREVLGGSAIGEVAARYGTSRQTLHSWRRRFEQEGMPGLLDRSRRPRNSPTRLSAEVEAEICELRRRHPRWGARLISHELSGRGLESAPSRATVHRVLSRNGLVRAQEQKHPRKYRPWQREAPMHLWQTDPAGRRQLLGSSAAAGDTAENSSDVPRSVRHSARTTVSVEPPTIRAPCEHDGRATRPLRSYSRTSGRREPPRPRARLLCHRRKSTGSSPSCAGQALRPVHVVERHTGRLGGRGSGTRHRRHGVRSRSSRVRAHPVPQREPAGLVLPDRDRDGPLDRNDTGDAGDRPRLRDRRHRPDQAAVHGVDHDNRRSPRRCSPPPSTSASPPASRSWRASPLQSTPRRVTASRCPRRTSTTTSCFSSRPATRPPGTPCPTPCWPSSSTPSSSPASRTSPP